MISVLFPLHYPSSIAQLTPISCNDVHPFSCVVQGNCTSQYTGDALVPAPTTPQCVLRTHQSFLALTDAAANLWLSDVYVVLIPAEAGGSTAPVATGENAGAPGVPTILNVAAANAWLTSSTFVGDSVNSRGINVGPGRRLYARGAFPAMPCCVLLPMSFLAESVTQQVDATTVSYTKPQHAP